MPTTMYGSHRQAQTGRVCTFRASFERVGECIEWDALIECRDGRHDVRDTLQPDAIDDPDHPHRAVVSAIGALIDGMKPN